jgi:hypothetical protein
MADVAEQLAMFLQHHLRLQTQIEKDVCEVAGNTSSKPKPVAACAWLGHNTNILPSVPPDACGPYGGLGQGMAENTAGDAQG